MANVDFDFDLFNEALNEAPTAGFGPQVNFGKMTMTVIVTWWDKNKGKFETRPFTNKPVDKSKGEHLQITFESDLSEFNSALTNPYKRRVDVRVSAVKADGKKDPKALTDWSETVEPSLKALLGKDWAKKFAKGIYCEWEDIETVELNKQGEKKGFAAKDRVTGEPKLNEAGNPVYYVNTVPRFKRFFKSKAECSTAREERFSKNGNAASDDLIASDIPAKIIADAKGLLQAVGLEQGKQILADTPPYNSYDLEELLTAANPLE